jgi:hypothetical protein
VPASIKIQEKYGDDVQVIFVESQAHSREDYESFAWRSKWMGNNAMWTDERPIPTVGQGLPETALIGIDGKVIMQGNPGDFGKKLEAAVDAEVKKAKSPPNGTPDALKPAWTAYLKGDVAGALAECDKVASDEAKAAHEQFMSLTKRQIARVKWLIDNGYLSEAENLANELGKSVKGNADLTLLVVGQITRMAAPDMAAEKEAEKAVASFIKDIVKKKPFDPANVKKAESLDKKYSGTKSGARAAHIAELAKVKNA